MTTSSIITHIFTTVLYIAILLYLCVYFQKSKKNLIASTKKDLNEASEKDKSILNAKIKKLEKKLQNQRKDIEKEYQDLISTSKEKSLAAKDELSRATLLAQESQNEKNRYEEEREKYTTKADICERKLEEYTKKLEGLTTLSQEEIQAEAKKVLAEKAEENLAFYAENYFSKRATKIEEEARAILLNTMQSLATRECQSATCSIVKISDEATKGKLIGKDGRNIRAFENATSANLIVDDTPDCVTVSSFDPVKKEIARITLENLLKDGRVNPSTIEEQSSIAKKEVEKIAKQKGNETLALLGVSNVDRAIVELLGKLHFHQSLNQNSLDHSIEAAILAGKLANELNLSPRIAIRATLLHDIAKVMTDIGTLSHAKAAAALLETCGEDPRIVNAVASHHNETQATSLYAAIVKIADSVSSARPGARVQATDSYFKRVKLLERIAYSFEGVADAYVIQSGKEMRVILKPEEISEVEAANLAAKIRYKISEAYDNLGVVKITLIREQRWTETSG